MGSPETRSENRRSLTVQTDLTTFCNLRCRMCYFHADLQVSKETVTYEGFRRMFEPWADRIRVLGLSCATEPLMVKQGELNRILRFIGEQGIPESSIVTNATLMSPSISRALVEAEVTCVQVSLDSHLPEKFEAIRIGASFERVIANVRELIACRKTCGATHPMLQFNCVLARCNIEDMVDYVDFIADLGADAVDFRHLVPYEGFGLDDQTLNHDKVLANRQLDLIRTRCRERGIHLQACPDNFRLADAPVSGSGAHDEPSSTAPEPAPSRVCTIPGWYVFVRPNGEVVPCTEWYEEPPMGNLAEVDFDTLWNSEEYRRLRDEVGRGVFTRRCCRTCPSEASGSVDEERAFEAKRF